MTFRRDSIGHPRRSSVQDTTLQFLSSESCSGDLYIDLQIIKLEVWLDLSSDGSSHAWNFGPNLCDYVMNILEDCMLPHGSTI